MVSAWLCKSFHSQCVKVWLRIRFTVPNGLLKISETFLKAIFNVFALPFISVKLQFCFVLTLQKGTKITLTYLVSSEEFLLIFSMSVQKNIIHVVLY